MLFIPALLGALVGSGMTSMFNLWKFHRDERSSRCDELCKAVTDASSLAVDYWSTDYSESDKQTVAEAKLRAAQDFFEGLFEDFCVFLSNENERLLQREFSDFVDILTGDTFTEPERKKDIERVRKCGPSASRITVLLRRANRETMPFHRLSVSYHKNRKRELDLPYWMNEDYKRQQRG